ncbi:MAG TPA: hypothetical protein VM165_13410 [Planctomycetaceae bacterium]|nr:hypothetical protein [Planctomycetaceae bacterium]
MNWKLVTVNGILSSLLGLAGCQSQAPTTTSGVDSAVQAALAKLDDADRPVAEAQRFCAVQTHQPLGSMGVPLKLDVQGQPVFVCCKGCEKKALSDPQATLARVEQLKSEPK